MNHAGIDKEHFMDYFYLLSRSKKGTRACVEVAIQHSSVYYEAAVRLGNGLGESLAHTVVATVGFAVVGLMEEADGDEVGEGVVCST